MTPTATDPSVVVAMKLLGAFLGLSGIFNIFSAAIKVRPLLEGAFAPHNFRMTVEIALSFLASIVFFVTARFLWQARTAGIRWGLGGVGFLALSAIITGRLGAHEVISGIVVVLVLTWCSNRIISESTGVVQ